MSDQPDRELISADELLAALPCVPWLLAVEGRASCALDGETRTIEDFSGPSAADAPEDRP